MRPAPTDLTTTTRLALMADTLIARRVDLQDDGACAVALFDERFRGSEITSCLTAAITVAREIQAVARRSLFAPIAKAEGRS